MASDSQAIPSDLLSGKKVVIAGGTGSVGRQLVEACLSGGATVVVPSRSAEKIDTLRSGLQPDWGSRLLTVEGDLGDPEDAARITHKIVDLTGSVDAAVASLGGFVPAPSILKAPLGDLQYALDGYLVAHFLVAQALIPVLNKSNSSYTFINGPLAFSPLFPGSGLISIATAGQAMLARVVMKELAEDSTRVNELVLYTSFGWGDDKRGKGTVSQEDVGRYTAYLVSDHGEEVRGQTIHLNSLDPLKALLERP